jgi:hypothetical protein
MTSSLLSRTVLALVAASGLSAAEVTFMDLRLGGGMLSNTFKGSSSTTIVDNSTSISSSSDNGGDGPDSDQNYRGQLQFVWGNLGPAGGLIIGAGVAVNHARFDDAVNDGEITTPVVDVLIGYGLAVTPEWHFELTPFAGIGRSYYSVKSGDSTSTSKDWDKYYEYGAKIGTYYTFAQRTQIGIEVPLLVGRFDADFDHQDNGHTVTLSDQRRNQGIGVLATVGVRF